jgi:hypothetical protein
MGMSVSTPPTLTLSSGSLGSLRDGVDDAVNAGSIANGVSGTSRNGSSSYNWSGSISRDSKMSWGSEVLIIAGSEASCNKVK